MTKKRNYIQTGNENKIPEGLVINRYFENKLIKKNQNIIFAITGATGTGKSFLCLSMVNNWYNYHFKENLPIENICFSIDEIMKLLHSKKLRKGEIIIMEEGGVLMNALNFQNKISKLFTFVLQSFRSMNIGIVMNLPVLSMLNKSARLLLHAHLITSGIDRDINKCKCKALFHQLNQTSGKSFWKYMRIKWNGKARKIERISYSYPRKELAEEYEKKKFKFVSDLNEGFVQKLEEQHAEEEYKDKRKDLSDVEKEVYDLLITGYSLKEIAVIVEKSYQNCHQTRTRIEKKGYKTKISKNAKKIKINEVEAQIT